jgi:RNA polymerase I-specific transcription initiation factor RRN3
MLILFQHVSDSSYTLSPQTLYTMILPSFDSSILMTHRSKFVQFVFFLLCGLDADLRQFGHALPPSWTLHHASLFREFTAKLLDVALDTHKDTTTRQSAICYLASFISRASYVNSETVCETVSTLLQFAEIYMDHFPNEASVRNAWKTSPCGMLGSPLNTSMDKTTMVEMHSLFYTVSQAVFYIMCFRGKECIQYYKQAQVYHDQQMENTDPTRKDYDAGSFADLDTVNVSSERWNRLCAHHLQPLRYCLETVRGEFLLLAHAFHLVDGELLQRLIMEDRKMATPIESSTSVATISPNIKKKATSIRTAATLEKSRLNGGVGGLGRGSNPLQSFFPFDPYLLCKSHKFIEKYYKHWTGSCVPDEEEDSEDESEESVELAEEVEDGLNEDSYDDENDGSTSDEEEEEEVESQTDTDEDLDTFPQDLLDNRNKAHLQNRKRPRVGSMTSNTDYSDLSASKRPRFGSMNSYTDASDPGISLSREEWVQELKRSRALSISITDECW